MGGISTGAFQIAPAAMPTKILVEAGAQDLRSSKHVKLMRFEDEESTEASSSAFCSDAESASGAEGSSGSCADDEVQPGEGRSASYGMRGHKCRAQHPRLPVGFRHKRWSCNEWFGTPLDPIPGTPTGMMEHPSWKLASSPTDEEPGREALLSTAPQGFTESAGAWLPLSPKRRALGAFMERAMQEGIPLKVSMQQGRAPIMKRCLDPTMPAKKRPILPEKALGPRHWRRLDPTTPVKKGISPWLIASPQRLLPSAPR